MKHFSNVVVFLIFTSILISPSIPREIQVEMVSQVWMAHQVFQAGEDYQESGWGQLFNQTMEDSDTVKLKWWLFFMLVKGPRGLVGDPGNNGSQGLVGETVSIINNWVSIINNWLMSDNEISVFQRN